MSHEFVPVQWNRQKWIYDGVLLAAIFIFLASFIIFGSRGRTASNRSYIIAAILGLSPHSLPWFTLVLP